MRYESEAPLVSVVVPCRNEKAHIENCLRSILAQEDVPGGFEVIVADGLSEDGTVALVKKIGRTDKRLRIVQNPARLTACGLNEGIRQARGRFIAVMGAHNLYAPDYLRSSLEVLLETGADNVGGSMLSRGESRMQKAIAIAHHSRFSVGGARWHDISYEGPADTVFGGFYRREVFERLGLFDETLVRNQDDEFNLRLLRAAGKIWQSPRIRSWYRPRAHLSALGRQYLQYGYWKVRVIQKHRMPASWRHLAPGSFVFFLTVLPFLAPLFLGALWIWLGLAGLYVAANLLVSAATAVRHGPLYLLYYLPPVFACYHFGYGIGFLCGIVDFVILHRQPAPAFTGLTRSSAPERI